ncbi:hypothetical protein QYF36_004592 [Acer negundo]|nr:hypothetical protein QYF36_004592 [Acer negundo]
MFSTRECQGMSSSSSGIVSSLKTQLSKFRCLVRDVEKQKQHQQQQMILVAGLTAPFFLVEFAFLMRLDYGFVCGADTLPQIFLQGYNVFHPMGWDGMGCIWIAC